MFVERPSDFKEEVGNTFTDGQTYRETPEER